MNKSRFVSMLPVCALASCALLAARSHSSQAAPVIKSASVSRIVKSSIAKRKGGKALCPNPRGIKLNVRAFFTITNADDGFRDNVVETYGEVLFGSWQIWKIKRGNAADKKKGNRMNAGDFTFNVMFDEPRPAKVFVSGFLSDRDKGLGNGDDTMWNPSKKTREINIREIYEQGGGGGRNGVYEWKGDRDSENADLTLVISKVGDIY